MRKLNRVLAASALAVPMALGVSGTAMADAAEDSSAVQNQDGSGEDDFETCVEQAEDPVDCLELTDQGDDDDNFLEDLLNALLGEDEENSDESNSGGNLLS
jgi:hypothetical protein